MSGPEVHSLTELYERYASAVFGFLWYLSGDRPLAEELTGETFYRALLAIDGFRGDASVKTWLLRIARNLYLRRVERERRTTSLEALTDAGDGLPDPAAGPEAAVIHKEQRQAVERALLALSESDRSLLLLAAEGLPQRDLAGLLGISLGAVKVRLHRARQRLAAALETASPAAHKEGAHGEL
jgi:RNA polymerase sigma-70 factor (ECF subfamily)